MTQHDSTLPDAGAGLENVDSTRLNMTQHDSTLPDAGAGLEDVEILENVGDSHQAESSQKSQA